MSSQAAARVYGGRTATQRRDERRRRLLDAALDLMGTEGWSATTVRGVCARARLSPRFFYESFEDLDALAVAAFDEMAVDTFARAAAAAAATYEPDARIRAVTEAVVHALTDDPRRARFAFLEALGSERLMQRRLDTMRLIARFAAAQARELYGFAADDDFVELTATMLAGGFTELLIVWTGGGLEMTRDELIDGMAELFGLTAAGVAARRAR